MGIAQRFDGGFELRHAACQVLDGLPLRIGESAVRQWILVEGPIVRHHTPGHADHGGVIGHRPNDHGARAYFYVIADVDVAEDFRSGADDDAIAQRGVTFARILSGAAERDALVYEYILSDLSRFADHNAHAVIDKKASADSCARVNFYAGQAARELADDAGQSEPSGQVEAVCEAVEQDGVKAGITQQDFRYAARRRVPAKHGVDLFTDGLEHSATLSPVIATFVLPARIKMES